MMYLPMRNPKLRQVTTCPVISLWSGGAEIWNLCLENSTNRGAWQDTVHGVAKSQTLNMYTCNPAGFQSSSPKLLHPPPLLLS